MLYIGEPEIPSSDDHEGFVAGRYPDGAYSGIWTDVRRCGDPTILAYAPACECGWRGTDHPATPAGYATARQAWFDDHFGLVAGTGTSLRQADFLTT